MFYDTCRVAEDDRVGWYAPAYYGVCTDDRVFSYNEFTLAADNDCSETNPTPFLDSDGSSPRHSRLTNGIGSVFILIVVIHDECARGNARILPNKDTVLGRYNTASRNPAAVFDYDYRFTVVGNT